MNNDDFTREPLKLLKNNSFPTYQLYAVVDQNKADRKEVLKLCILESLSWLRKRFREFDIPRQIRAPEPDQYDSIKYEDFKSFHIDEGYIVDVVFVPEDGIWAMNLIEPDLGPRPGDEVQTRCAVPGRVFTTNIAYRITGGNVECGFKTVCSEPIGTKEKCEVYRLAVIKSIVRNKKLGLRQCIPLIEHTNQINNREKIKELRNLIKNNNRQLPIVLISEYFDTKRLNNVDKGPSKDSIKSYINSIDKAKLQIDGIDNTDSKPQMMGYDTAINVNNFARYKMGYAHFAILQYDLIDDFNKLMGSDYEMKNGDLRLIYPLRFSDVSEYYQKDYICCNKVDFERYLDDKLQNYPKYKDVDFGRVKFVNEARIIEQQNIIKRSKSKADVINAVEKQQESISKKYEEKIKKLQSEINDKERSINSLKSENFKLEQNIRRLNGTIEDMKVAHNTELERMNSVIVRKDQVIDRPKKPDKIPDWVARNFKGKLILHQRAINMIKNTPQSEVSMDTLCSALEYLAYEYREEQLGNITQEERNKLCQERYNRPFRIIPSGDMSINKYSKDYKVKYGKGYKGRPVERALDTHLRVGTDSENLLRIYFFFDKNEKIVVVGSMPKHLKTMTNNT